MELGIALALMFGLLLLCYANWYQYKEREK